MIFIGPISSIFDYATFFLMLYVFGAEDVAEQASTVPHRLVRRIAADADADRPHHPHREDSVRPKQRERGADHDSDRHRDRRDHLALHPIGASLGFVPLPPLYWPIVIAIIGCYAVLTHLVKTWFVRRWGM